MHKGFKYGLKQLNKNKQIQKTWEYSDEYSNVIIVNIWRYNMDEQKEIQALLPTWRKTLLATHVIITNVVGTICHPFIWFAEQFNGTQDFKDIWFRVQNPLTEDKSNKPTDTQ